MAKFVIVGDPSNKAHFIRHMDNDRVTTSCGRDILYHTAEQVSFLDEVTFDNFCKACNENLAQALGVIKE